MARLPRIVESPSPTDGQVLAYDSTAKKWKPATPSGGGGGTVPDATTTVKGIVELATTTETTTGTDTVRAVTPAGVKAVADTKAPASHSHNLADLDTTGTPDGTKFLRGDGAWATPEGGGGGNTHTSADATRPALPAGTVWLSTAATRPATMQTGDIWIGEPL